MGATVGEETMKMGKLFNNDGQVKKIQIINAVRATKYYSVRLCKDFAHFYTNYTTQLNLRLLQR